MREFAASHISYMYSEFGIGTKLRWPNKWGNWQPVPSFVGSPQLSAYAKLTIHIRCFTYRFQFGAIMFPGIPISETSSHFHILCNLAWERWQTLLEREPCGFLRLLCYYTWSSSYFMFVNCDIVLFNFSLSILFLHPLICLSIFINIWSFMSSFPLNFPSGC